MKKIIFTLILLSSLSAFSQFSFGLRAGLNYGSLDSFSNFEDSNLGYHFGFQSRIDLPLLYIMPELVYTKLEGTQKNNLTDIDLQKIDLPVSLGIKMLGIFSVFAGPGLQYIIMADSNKVDIESIEKNLSVFFNVGAGVKISKFGINLRYERGLSKSDINVVEKNTKIPLSVVSSKINVSPNQFILSATYSF